MKGTPWLRFYIVLAAFTLAVLLPNLTLGKPVRELTLSDDEIGTIRTALDLSTVLKFEGRPNQAILGAQDAFKVEFVQNSVTIKPIQPGVKTNLFVFTDKEGFYFNLAPVSQAQADQVVRVSRKRRSDASIQEGDATQKSRNPTPLIQKNIGRSETHGDIELTLHSLAWPKSKSSFLVGFSLSLSGNAETKELRFSPGDFVLKQGKREIIIQDFFVESLSLTPAEETKGMILIRSSAITPGEKTELSFRLPGKKGASAKYISITVPRYGPLWK